MDDFDELQQLRRLKELEAKAAGEKSIMDSAGKPKGILDTVSEYVPDSVKNIGSAVVKGVAGFPALLVDANAGANSPEDAGKRAQNELKRRETDGSWLDSIVGPSKKQLEAKVAEAEKRSKEMAANPSQGAFHSVQNFGYIPKTQGERYIDQGVQGAVGAMTGPGGLAGKVPAAITGFTGGVTGEAAGQLPDIKGTPSEPYARVAGALVGGIGSGAVLGLKKNSKDIAQEAFADWTPEDFAKARSMMEKAKIGGVNLNVGQAAGRDSNVDRVIDALVTHRQGAPLAQQLREQPEQIGELMRKMQSGVPGVVQEPAVIANTTQQAATNALEAARKFRTNSVKPLYDQAGEFPAPVLTQISDKLGTLIPRLSTNLGDLTADLKGIFDKAVQATKGVPTGVLDSAGNPIMKPAAPMTMSEVNDAMRSLTNSLKNVNLSAKAGDREAVKGLQSLVKDIRTTMGDISEPFKQGNALYAKISEELVDPLKKSVIGRVAGSQGALADKEAVNKLLPIIAKGRNPEAQSSDIIKFARQTSDTPEVFQDAVKTHISNAVANAEHSIAGQEGANIALALKNQLFATPAQQQGLVDALQGIAIQTKRDPNAIVNGFMNGLKLIEAASKRPANVGMSANDVKEMAGKSGIASGVQLLSLNAGNQAGKGFRGWVTAKTYRELAENLTTKEGLDRLQALAKQPVMSRKAQVLLNTLVTTGQQAKAGGVRNVTPIGNEEEEQ